MKILLVLASLTIFITSMIKAHIKYLITLCILLLSVSSQLVANTHPRTNLHASSDDNIRNLQSNINTYMSASFGNSENTFFDYDEKIEEDKEYSIILQKKNLENTYISSTLFYSWYNKFFLLSNIKVSHFSKHLSHFSYHKLFIVFQVFRI